MIAPCNTRAAVSSDQIQSNCEIVVPSQIYRTDRDVPALAASCNEHLHAAFQASRDTYLFVRFFPGPMESDKTCRLVEASSWGIHMGIRRRARGKTWNADASTVGVSPLQV